MSQARTTITTALLAVLTVSSVAGCSGTPKPAPSTSTVSKVPTSSATTSTPSTKPAPTPSQDGYTGPASVPLAARAHTDAGRIAFAKHYIDQINETGKNPQTGILEPLALPTCKTCANFAGTVKQMVKGKQHLDGTTFENIRTGPSLGSVVPAVELLCSQSLIHRVDSFGKVLESAQQIPHLGIVLYIRWMNRQWKISAIKFDESAPK